jgi:asparagine synthase (glutamine-hydrolysing)
VCGIAGVAGLRDRAAAEQALGRMAASMVHRGPDDQGIEVVAESPAVGLCARRLAIQDLSPLGHQPMRSEQTGAAVALNGELYNVRELRDDLSAAGHRFRGHSDTEVALCAFDEWGDGCVERFRGMFAVAFWDERNRRLLIARDRLGIKPLFYSAAEGRLVFASEVRALLASGLVEGRVSAAGLASYLSLGAVREPLTILDHVECLAPGSLAVWEHGDLSVHSYWSLQDAFSDSAAPLPRDDAVAQLRETLEEAVRQHLVSDVPLGVFLSGGIDSSAMVALVSAVDRPPRTVSVVFPQQRFSEERYIRVVRDRFGTEHTEVELDDAAILAVVPGALAAMDQPSNDGVNTYVVSRVAKESGLTVVLSGLGGDELFGGYDTFQIVRRLEAARRLVPSVAGPAAAALIRAATRGRDAGLKLARWVGGEHADLSAYELRRELFSPDMRAELMSVAPDGHVPLPVTPADRMNAVSLLELDVYMRNQLLRDSDVMSMAHSLELRVPLLDHRLVEAAAACRGDWKADRHKPKPLLVDALADLLPDEVVYRTKMGFTLPFVDWLRGSLRRSVESALLDPAYGGQVAELLDPAAVRNVWDRFLAGRAIWVRPWALYVAKEWGERNAPR